MARIEQSPPDGRVHKKLIVFGHAASCIALIHSLAGPNVNNGKPVRIGTCSLTTLNRKKGEKQGDTVLKAFDVAALADTSFLDNGNERDWGFEDILVDEQGTVVNDHGVKGTEGQMDDSEGFQQYTSARM